MGLSPHAQFGAAHLRNLIADVLARPYRAFSFRGVAPAGVIDQVPGAVLASEIATIPAAQCVLCSGAFEVYWARASQIPFALQEIGRLREITFRAAGEGSGKPADIDTYDSHYLHLFVWDAHASCIVGAY